MAKASKIDEETARQVLREAEERRARETQDSMASKRDQDRTVARPSHFHATIWTFHEKDAGGNMKDATHHEVLAMSPDAAIRKAKNRAEPGQDQHHLAQLSECTDPTHGSRELRD